MTGWRGAGRGDERLTPKRLTRHPLTACLAQAGEMSAEERSGLPDVRPVRDDRGQYTLVYPAPGSWTQVIVY
jgi:hypothetical protein